MFGQSFSARHAGRASPPAQGIAEKRGNPGFSPKAGHAGAFGDPRQSGAEPVSTGGGPDHRASAPLAHPQTSGGESRYSPARTRTAHMSRPPEIAFFPEASFGAALNCVGIAQELQRQGANPVFICHAGFTGVFAEYGFKEYHLPDHPGSSAEAIADYWQDFINTHLPHFDLSPLAQLDTYVGPTWRAIVETAIAAEDDLARLLAQIRPDAIVLDNVIMFPAIANAGCPWVRIVSCAETEIPDAGVPPYLSGLVPGEDTGAFDAAYADATRDVHRQYNTFRKRHGLPALPPGIFLEPSADLNLLLAPQAVRYERAKPLDPERFVFLEGCVRHENDYESPRFAV